MRPRDYAPLGERQYDDELPDTDEPSPAVLWIVGAIGILCVVSLVVAGVIVTTD